MIPENPTSLLSSVASATSAALSTTAGPTELVVYTDADWA
jgi:hypothetical protein